MGGKLKVLGDVKGFLRKAHLFLEIEMLFGMIKV